jgi:hypothetical protein
MTRPFTAIERFFERLFERPAARLFHTPVQPIQMQRKLERAMDTGRVFSSDRTYVPVRYRVRLNPEDVQAFADSRAEIETELADALHARARSRGYRLLARPTVRIEASSRTAVADIDVMAEEIDQARLDALTGRPEGAGPRGTGVYGSVHIAPSLPPSSPRPMAPIPAPPAPLDVAGFDAMSYGVDGLDYPAALPAARPAAPAAPAALPPAPAAPAALPAAEYAAPEHPGQGYALPQFAAPEPISDAAEIAPSMADPTVAFAYAQPPAALARIEVRTHGLLVGTYEFRSGAARVGRASSNEIPLTDDRVSRHHGQVSSRQGTLVYTDLGSTNGSFVNGTRVREIVLGSGDVVRLGNSTLTIQPHA